MERGGGSEEGAVMKVPPGPCGRADLLRSYERQGGRNGWEKTELVAVITANKTSPHPCQLSAMEKLTGVSVLLQEGFSWPRCRIQRGFWKSLGALVAEEEVLVLQRVGYSLPFRGEHPSR